jgi:hypothetical protein
LILAGAVGVAVGFSRGFSGRYAMLAGILAVGLGTIEVIWREHRSGFRSHTLLLSLLPVVAFHSAAVLLAAVLASAPALLNVGLLAVDVPLFAALFKALRARFLDARARAAGLRQG